MNRQTLIKLFAALCAGIVTLLTCELLLRLFGPPPQYAYNDYVLQLSKRHLFQLKPSVGPDINQAGFRDNEFPKTRSAKRRILFVGDSFAMGVNVDSKNSMPKVLERILGTHHEVFNFGIFGYGPDQALIRLVDEGLSYQPDIVVLSLFPGNDFGDLHKNDLFRANESGTSIEFNPNNPVAEHMPWSRVMFLLSKIMPTGYLNPRADNSLMMRLLDDTYFQLSLQTAPVQTKCRSLMGLVLRSFKRELDARNIPFVVMIIPTQQNIVDPKHLVELGVAEEDYFANERAVESICRAEKIPHLSLEPVLKKYKDQQPFDLEDYHLSVLGYRVAAEALAEFLRHRGLIDDVIQP